VHRCQKTEPLTPVHQLKAWLFTCPKLGATFFPWTGDFSVNPTSQRVKRKKEKKLTSHLVHITGDVVEFRAMDVETMGALKHTIPVLVSLIDSTIIALGNVREIRIVKRATVSHGGHVNFLGSDPLIGFVLQVRERPNLYGELGTSYNGEQENVHQIWVDVVPIAFEEYRGHWRLNSTTRSG
jgi:hypothetical protein